MTTAERVAALAERGIMLYLAPDGQLRARCEASVQHVLEAAGPILKQQRKQIIEYLHSLPSCTRTPRPSVQESGDPTPVPAASEGGPLGA